MQPFLSGETTLALLLITLTLLLFAAAGDEHPYEPYHRKYPVEAGRSSVELAAEQPQVKADELVVRLDCLQQQTGNLDREERRRRRRRTTTTEVARREITRKGVGFGLAKPEPYSYLLRSSSLTSRLPSRFRPRNLEVLAALLSYQSLHTSPLPTTPLSLSSILKSDMAGGWSLGGLGLPLLKTVRGRSLRSIQQCRGKGVKYVGGAGGGASGEEEVWQWQRERRGEEKPSELQLQQGLRSAGGRAVEVIGD
ncbi:hypothetical protein QBC32DRAFT_340403 [Pseudoneurospora amorphoporcata]|uniref:Uncharacterized protein n=1 Tax=Pseudoneurospora amorphoporcata TaxID=241081 RepID=A0AAN6SGJ4_9PEZI|nr:hypothetical protein QBC32DRAFT_340403 [Pseudoneurospora amorphoporcata]